MDALWERTPPMSRDRSSRLTREEIAAAAFAVAEAENLTAVTVKRIAGRLGIPAARLQNYLTDRGELLDLMADEALGEVALGEILETSGWPVQLWHIAHAVRATVQRHTWMSALLGLRAPTGPHGLRFSERCLRAFAASDVDVHTAARRVEAVLVFVCGSVRPGAVSTAPAPVADDSMSKYLMRQVTGQTHPLLAQLLGRPAEFTADDAFDTGLGYLLGGMGVELDLGSPPADAAYTTEEENS